MAGLLEVTDLNVGFRTDDGLVQAVRGVSLDIGPGEVVAVVGESGSGKSVTAMSMLQLLPPMAEIHGSVKWGDEELLEAPERRMRAVRGGEIAVIFQDPLSALNPVYRVGNQIVEMVLAHQDISRREAKARAVEMLGLVGIPQPERRARQYPHEFSGGMRQRAMIAMALANEPKLVIADEPTTALDVTVQAQVLELLVDLTDRLDTAVMLITHDLGVVAGLADRVVVMYAGRVVERGTVDEIFEHTSHPYSAGLLRSLPRLDEGEDSPLVPIGGQPPSMLHPPAGCAFHPRCPHASKAAGCLDRLPELEPHGSPPHEAACFRSDELLAADLLSRHGVNA
ncbi:MAG TPA: ABC transporter ATP-binding protein [Acidimicrobiales bacterium]|jgi:oligopeptide/dipeptide ABC transporter ATP-binding protein|nr:ABC transporter ATP-binding protein [Acidimicrobiales bacterium]